jgi:hypothetical protein
MSIYYCSECDGYSKGELKPNEYRECDCGEQCIELSEDDLLIKIEEMQAIIFNLGE